MHPPAARPYDLPPSEAIRNQIAELDAESDLLRRLLRIVVVIESREVATPPSDGAGRVVTCA